MNKKEILRIAKLVRNTIIEGNKTFGHFEDDLGGACAMASVFLFVELQKANFDPVIATSEFHFFIVERKLNLLVDVTATQFGQPQIIVKNYDSVKRIIKEKIDAPWWNAVDFYTSISKSNLKQELNYVRRYINVVNAQNA